MQIHWAWASANQQVVAIYWIASKSTEKFPRKWRQEFWIPHAAVTLNKSQGHSNWYQHVELSGPHPHTQFERNRLLYVWIQANVRIFSLEYWMDKIKWVLASSHQQVSTVYQIPSIWTENREISRADFFFFFFFCFFALLWPCIKVKVSYTTIKM